MAYDATKPNTGQTVGNAIISANANDVALKAQLDAHEANSGDAHGLAAILAFQSTTETHMANESDAHGIDAIISNLAAAQVEIANGRGSQLTLGQRLAVALANDGSIKLSSLASKWIDNGDAPTYVSTTSFTTPGDRTKVYIAGALLRCTIGTGYVYAPVSASSYSAGSGLTTVTLDAGYPVLTAGVSKVEIALIAWDNAVAAAATQNAADIINLQAAITSLKLLRLPGSKTGAPGAAEVLLRYVALESFTLPINLAGSQMKAGTVATASTVFNLAKNGGNFGTATFAPAGAVATFAAASSTSVNAGDVITLTAPASPDATLADIAFNLKGVLP